MYGSSIRAQLAVLALLMFTLVAALLGIVLPRQVEAMGRAAMERRAVGLTQVVGRAVAPAVDFEDVAYVAEAIAGPRDGRGGPVRGGGKARRPSLRRLHPELRPAG